MPGPDAANGVNGEPTEKSKAEDGNIAVSEQTNERKKLSNAEMKKLQKQEKAARRAKEKESKAPDQVQPTTIPSSATQQSSRHLGEKQQSKTQPGNPHSKAQGPSQPKTRRVSNAALTPAKAELPLRQNHSEATSTLKAVPFFAHAYSTARRRGLAGTPKDVHPAISTLALHFSSYMICGSHARGVATLLAFKSVVQSYTTPSGTSLTRHFVSHHLPPQINHLKAARPLSTTQANAIRWLKNFIAKLDPSAQEDTAKADICTAIDTFINERFTVADRVIIDTLASQMQNGDAIVTFGNSAVIRESLLAAASRGLQISVTVVDSRPLFEGRAMAQALSSAGVDVRYCLLSGIDRVMTGATKCVLGAHTVLANGNIQSRSGAALVAMTAKRRRVPLMICAETIKFSERVALDSIVTNEVAPEEELLLGPEHTADAVAPPKDAVQQKVGKNKQDTLGPDKSSSDAATDPDPLASWNRLDNLYLLNLLYDVTPAEYVDHIITELGSLTPGSSAAVQRLSGEVE